MKQNINKNSSDREKITSVNLANSVQKKSLQKENADYKNEKLQQEQVRHLSRILEAYCDCV